MENSIKKMIEEYNEKVRLEDIRLDSVGQQIKEARAAGECYEDLRSDKKVISARRQAYVQAAVDFDSLLDNIAAKTSCPLYVDYKKSCQALKDNELMRKGIDPRG